MDEMFKDWVVNALPKHLSVTEIYR